MIVGVETGGTKIVCAASAEAEPGRVLHIDTSPTTDPASTIARIREFVRDIDRRHGVSAIGVASFGPLELDQRSPQFGCITSTPKPGWSGTDLLGPLRRDVDVPQAFTTDVNAAAIAEHRLRRETVSGNLAYVTVGTGIGAGILIDGALMAGSGYPEVAHLRVVRHPDDTFAGVCRFHGDCLEGLASGPAIEARWGANGSVLQGSGRRDAVEVESFYLGQLAATLRYLVGTDLVVLGGGVADTPGLVEAVAARVEHASGAAGGSGRAPLRLAAASLNGRSGVVGALLLAAEALAADALTSGARAPEAAAQQSSGRGVEVARA